MLLIEYVGHIGLRSLTDGHLGRHLEYFKTLNDARVASVGFIKYNASTTRINKEKNFKIKFQVILVFYRTIIMCLPLSVLTIGAMNWSTIVAFPGHTQFFSHLHIMVGPCTKFHIAS